MMIQLLLLTPSDRRTFFTDFQRYTGGKNPSATRQVVFRARPLGVGGLEGVRLPKSHRRA